MKLIVPVYIITIIVLGYSLHQEPGLKESIKKGSEIYADFCVNCHMDTGEGIPYTYPPLAKSDYLMNNRQAALHAVKYGLQGEITVNGVSYNSAMTSLGLEDEEIADVMNFIMNSWGNTQDKMVTEKEVGSIKK